MIHESVSSDLSAFLNMQTVVLGLMLVVGAVTALPQANISGVNSKLDEWEEYCSKETGFDKSTNISVDNVPRSAKCFAACLLEKEGSLKTDGSLDGDVAKNSEVVRAFNGGLISDKLRNILEECAKDGKIVAEDKCETADNFIICVSEKISKVSADDKKN